MDKVYHPRISMQSLQETYDDLIDICIHICVFMCVYHICVFICIYKYRYPILRQKNIRAGCWRFSTQVGKDGFKCGTIIKECRSIPWSSRLRGSRASTCWFPILVPMLPCGPVARRGEKSGFFFTEALRIGSQKGCHGLPSDMRMWYDVIQWMMWTTFSVFEWHLLKDWMAEWLTSGFAEMVICYFWEIHHESPWLGNLQSWPN